MVTGQADLDGYGPLLCPRAEQRTARAAQPPRLARVSRRNLVAGPRLVGCRRSPPWLWFSHYYAVGTMTIGSTVERPALKETVKLVLGVARLGEVDLAGWWGSHGLDRVGRYVLSRSFRRTWQVAALELDILSATRRHNEAARAGAQRCTCSATSSRSAVGLLLARRPESPRRARSHF